MKSETLGGNRCKLFVISSAPGKKVMMDASVLGRSSKSEATSADP